MKKSTILTFATAAAIVATSAGTFALWDTLSATKTATLTIRNPVTVTAQADAVSLKSETVLDALPVYEGSAKFDLESVPTGYEIEPKVTVKKGADEVAAEKLTVNSEVVGGTTVEAGKSTKEVKVTVTPTAGATDLAGQSLNVEVTAKLVKTTPTN